MKTDLESWNTNLEPWKTMKTDIEPWQPNLEPWKTMKTDLEVEVEVDLRQLGKVLIFRDKQNLPIIYRYGQPLRAIAINFFFEYFPWVKSVMNVKN